jgi:hypothetical protein
MTLIVYPCGPGRGELLRYSLRSLEAAAGDQLPEVVLIGEIPSYIDCASLRVIPMVQRSDRFTNVWRTWEVAGRLFDGVWWWFNDDFMLGASLEAALVDAHRGPLERFCDGLARRGDVGMYRRRAQAALGVLRAEGYADPMNWEAHRPLRVHGGGAVWLAGDVCGRHGIAPEQAAVRTLIATLDRRQAPALPDPKNDHRTDVIDGPVVSLGPRAWRGAHGHLIRSRYDTPSHWERA